MKLQLIAVLLSALLAVCLAQAETDGLVTSNEKAADTQEAAPVETGEKHEDNLTEENQEKLDESVPEDKPDQEDSVTENDESVPEELKDEVRQKRSVTQLSSYSCKVLKRYGYCNVANIARFCRNTCCHDLLSAKSCRVVRYTYKRCNHNVGRVYCRRTCGQCLPPQCYKYRSINDITRRRSRYSKSNIKCDNRLAAGWYRFVGYTGTYIWNRCPRSANRCGTHAPGWVNGAYPSRVGQSVTRRVCYKWGGKCCNWSNNIVITHCRSFYVFYLRKPPNCHLRYCGSS